MDALERRMKFGPGLRAVGAGASAGAFADMVPLTGRHVNVQSNASCHENVCQAHPQKADTKRMFVFCDRDLGPCPRVIDV